MDTDSRIARLLRKLEQQGLATSTLLLYAEGLKAKLRQAHFSLKMLKDLEHLEDRVGIQDATTIPGAQDLLTVSEQVYFYCDCFWDFLYSSLDILGQLINKLRSIHISERSVNLKTIAACVKSTAPRSPLDERLSKLLSSYTFKQLEDYRHCSRHRRSIYIEKRTTTSTGTPGYDAGTGQITNRYLCTNPWDLAPHINGGKRPVYPYCALLLRRIEWHLDRVVNSLP